MDVWGLVVQHVWSGRLCSVDLISIIQRLFIPSTNVKISYAFACLVTDNLYAEKEIHTNVPLFRFSKTCLQN